MGEPESRVMLPKTARPVATWLSALEPATSRPGLGLSCVSAERRFSVFTLLAPGPPPVPQVSLSPSTFSKTHERTEPAAQRLSGQDARSQRRLFQGVFLCGLVASPFPLLREK